MRKWWVTDATKEGVVTYNGVKEAPSAYHAKQKALWECDQIKNYAGMRTFETTEYFDDE